MKHGPIAALALTATLLAGCTTAGNLPPTEVLRYHLGADVARGTIAVAPPADAGPATIEFQTYADAVRAQLLQAGYADPAPGTPAQFTAIVTFDTQTQEGPPRRSPFSVGLGGASFGGNRGGGVGLGGGVSFPVGGGGRGREVLLTQLSVAIQRADRTPVWEGHAHTAADLRSPQSATPAQAAKLAAALFTGFPGESGRTITVR
ncbi:MULTISPECIES: DUF4136 domain-containing protein [unclassified Sphingomonas]|uniref:DUF4136 domain-containing protein n=1 Tax=unclassified Sphingomonas TaxID=196159 RepID=UPI001F589109|nr:MULTISPECIES: DUF4136 domain-containing protein [unclassified Sphingomonas]